MRMGWPTRPTRWAADGPSRACWKSCTTAASVALARWRFVCRCWRVGRCFLPCRWRGFPFYLLSAHVLCRWTTLPMGAFVGSARSDGLGAKLAHKIPLSSAIIGTVLAFLIVGWALRMQALVADRGGEPDHAAQQLVLPLADWRHHRRLLWRDQPVRRNRGLRLRGVGMNRHYYPSSGGTLHFDSGTPCAHGYGRTLLRPQRSAAQRARSGPAI